MKKTNKNSPSNKKQSGRSSLRMITILLSVTFAVVWAASMACLTYAFAIMIMQQEETTAGDYYREIRYAVTDEGYTLDRLFLEPESDDFRLQDTIPSVLEIAAVHAAASNMISGDNVAEATFGSSWDEYYSDIVPLLADAEVPVTTGIVIRDADGSVIAQSGDVMEADEWYSQEAWDQGCQDESRAGTSCWIDLSDTELQAKMKPLYDLQKKGLNYDPTLCPVVKITGVLEGRKLIPKAVWYITEEGLRGTRVSDYDPEQWGEWWDGESLSAMDADVGIDWTEMFDDIADAEGELVTYYAVYPTLYIYDAAPITYRNSDYDSAVALLQQSTLYDSQGEICSESTEICSESSYSIWQVSYRSEYAYYPAEFYDESYDAAAAAITPEITVDYIYIAYPVRGAIRILRHIYLVTLLLMALIVWFLRRKMYRSLVLPMKILNRSLTEQQGKIDRSELWKNRVTLWDEQQELYESYQEEMSRRRADRDRIVDLDRALKYAQQAEKNRREMTSAIAHELKTPLAIIHSYAEGLQANIAEDKRDEYLNVIMTETERMDDMVLEMLDLSRLESGRAKMNKAEMSLKELVEEQLHRFEPSIAERHLQVQTDLSFEGLIQGDRKRLGQVVDNFISNAVRYTPEGGNVRIRLTEESGITFTVENDAAKKFTPEELTKVWDSFYRTDPARSNRSSGLGLAIAKNIIELHDGTCRAYNTASGVGFSFCLPMLIQGQAPD